jgi:hypothetical protein
MAAEVESKADMDTRLNSDAVSFKQKDGDGPVWSIG